MTRGSRGRSRIGLPLFALATLLLAAQAIALPVAKKTLAFKNKAIEVSIAYPRTGNAVIDGVLAGYAKRQLADDKKSPPAMDMGGSPFRHVLTYEIARNDAEVFSVLFTVSLDEGGLHPTWGMESFNFLLPDGEQLFLPQLVGGARGLSRLRQLAVSDLKRQFAAKAGGSDPERIERGLEASPQDFQTFVLRAKAIEVIFQPYQVAAYSEGAPHVSVPLDSLKSFIRADWRAQPSFACPKAKTSIESAICTDRTLMRLDREVAGLYAAQLASGYGIESLARLRASQRDWLGKRDVSCKLPKEPASCLRRSYETRIQVLRKYNP